MKKAVIFTIILALCLSLSCSASKSGSWWKGDVLTSKDSCKKQIALTFDDGPHPVLTPKILKILKKFNVRATFFVVGENAENYPQLIIDELSGGHEIGNHTFRHTTLKNKSLSSLMSEIEQTEEALFEICEYRTKLIRPPGGLYRENLCDYADKNDYTVVLWSIDTRDWAHRPAKDIYSDVVKEINGGDIILCHDYIGRYSPTPELLEMLIPKLIDMGYEFVTVSELKYAE